MVVVVESMENLEQSLKSNVTTSVKYGKAKTVIEHQ